MIKKYKTVSGVWDGVQQSTLVIFIAILVFFLIQMFMIGIIESKIDENTTQILKLERTILDLRLRCLDSNLIVIHPKQRIYPRILIRELVMVQ